MQKDQGLQPSFFHVRLRQGRSPLFPTLPYQQTNRYAVVGITNFSYPELAYKSTFVHLQNIAHLTINSTIYPPICPDWASSAFSLQFAFST